MGREGREGMEKDMKVEEKRKPVFVLALPRIDVGPMAANNDERSQRFGVLLPLQTEKIKYENPNMYTNRFLFHSFPFYMLMLSSLLFLPFSSLFFVLDIVLLFLFASASFSPWSSSPLLLFSSSSPILFFTLGVRYAIRVFPFAQTFP